MSDQIELYRLVGQQMNSVMVSTNSIRLQLASYPLNRSGQFEDSTVLEIEHGYQIVSESGELSAVQADGLDAFRCNAHGFLHLVEKTVALANVGAGGELVLVFDEGTQVRLLSSDSGFAAYHVHQFRSDEG